MEVVHQFWSEMPGKRIMCTCFLNEWKVTKKSEMVLEMVGEPGGTSASCCDTRLLKNSVSAQQAREKNKAYLSNLETRVQDLENRKSVKIGRKGEKSK
ncbi:hypothetical protein vseg_007428 [Gypsophila vaccaria]